MSKVPPAPANVNLAEPKDTSFTLDELKQYDGSDATKPIYVAVKGTVFDVTTDPTKRDTYRPGASYHVFAGKDASKALGLSSLQPEDAIADYSSLDTAQLKVLDDWYEYYKGKYNIVGKVVS
ncbi:hypothetical protein Glove_395g46 [Diversispora epigaea]|uniref:Cytochrome b5 heme-binding domain-containing protein n=1 Tax=Diversispora epigaea TaxID=1348612 RepID=A0A397H9F0_9GLOM|nr:hypothetical protein Glove_395g46 [Diversispora epigaea]